MGSIPHELRLDVRPTFIPKTISEFLGELTEIGSASEKLMRLNDFVKRLEDEMRKIDAFKRELPLCMILLNDAIVTLKEESTECRARNVEPVLEKFIPLKKNCSEDEESGVKEEKDRDKMNWMSSVQLWNNNDCKNIGSKHNQKQNSVPQFMQGVREDCPLVNDGPFECNKNKTGSKTFTPFKVCSIFPATTMRKEDKMEIPGLSLLTPGTNNLREEVGSNGLSSKISGSIAESSTTTTNYSNLRARPQTPQQQNARKQRRCWSPELHRRFVNALQQLGGSQAATPKQIRDLMQVDGLTNDEVKSHLQKYRLHTRRLPNATGTPANQPLVLSGGLWMPQDQNGESSKQSSSQSGSPQGPFHLAGTGGGTSTTGGESMEDEDDEAKSESYCWKSHIPMSGKVDV
ncbi:Myb family transcription factor EFM like [Actinidia chinensis var. chinensis]|uniref:Myb family transcription factor EFM like n=1 Tax=Actinidia chinensis var. chinensis TaxID=1590841 RepID=A0A2R6RH94_ACTCC|nr:Myb family transcription factor EFM like [Actinidia chinensis var. chinensis]